jgi:hypothetical protein
MVIKMKEKEREKQYVTMMVEMLVLNCYFAHRRPSQQRNTAVVLRRCR